MSILNKLVYILTAKERKAFLALVLCMVIGMGMEMLSVSLFVPCIMLLTNSSLYTKYPFLFNKLNHFKVFSQNEFIILLVLGMIVVYFLKTTFLQYVSIKQNKFTFGMQENISNRLFIKYLKKSWTFYLQRNSSALVNNVIQEISVLNAQILQSGLVLLTEIFVQGGIILLMMCMVPVETLLILSLFSILILVYQAYSKKTLRKYGEERQKYDMLRLKYLQEGLNGIKDIKLMNKEHYFFRQYVVANQMAINVNRKQKLLTEAPRLWVELLSVSVMGVIIISMVLRNGSIDLLLPIITMFAAAAFRLLPSLNRCMACVQNIRYGLPALDNLFNEFQPDMLDELDTKMKDVIFKKEIFLDNISFQYENTSKFVLKNVNIRIPLGSSVGIVGPSGEGKTTLVDLILGLLPVTQGNIFVDSVNIKDNPYGWRSTIGYVSQTVYLTDDSLKKNIAFGLKDEEIDECKLSKAILAAQLSNLIDSLPDKLETIVGERGVRLSGGQRQRIAIARALYNEPKIIVLDEATSALDPEIENEIMKIIYSMKGTITLVIISHRLSTMSLCDNVYRVQNGGVKLLSNLPARNNKIAYCQSTVD